MGMVSWRGVMAPWPRSRKGFLLERLALGHQPGGAKHHLVLTDQLNRCRSSRPRARSLPGRPVA
jgi:hypothetical protein